MSFKIWNDSDAGFQTRIEIDGAEVTAQFSNLSITAGFDTFVKVELDMPIVEQGTHPGAPSRLVFPMAESRELLVKHGWTPPAEDVVAVVAPAIEV